MKRRVGIGVGIAVAAVVAVLALAVWRCHGGTRRADSDGSGSSTVHGSARPRVDPRTLARGAVAGTIRDDRGGPIAGARVCAEWDSPALSPQLTSEPICVAAGTDGAYRLVNLVAADYTVTAMAPHFVPATVGDDDAAVSLAAGETKTIDLVLAHGGVEVTGTVVDIGGGPIAQARVVGRTRGSTYVESDALGRFRLWLAPGTGEVRASADGYAPATEEIAAPGALELVLTPESSIAGTVVDAATGEPRASVPVEATLLDVVAYRPRLADLTDEHGRFRIRGVVPGRYSVVARADDAYGRPDDSTLVGLAQHVDGILVKLVRAYRIEGTVIDVDTKQPCAPAAVSYDRDPTRTLHLFEGRGRADGERLVLAGLLPGDYELDIRCRGHYLVGDKPIVRVSDRDVVGLVWNMATGGSVRGHVRTASGTPIVGASVDANARAGRNDGAWGRSDSTGAFELAGLRPGRYALEVTDPPRRMSAVEIAVGAGVVERDLQLADGGAVTGIVVDDRAAAIAGVQVLAFDGAVATSATTRADGSFAIEGLAPGDYRLMASRHDAALNAPGPRHETPGVPVRVAANKTATARIVVEAETASIRGRFVDASRAPIADAFVHAVREDPDEPKRAAIEAHWDYDARLHVTAADGTFELDGLAAGVYMVRAYRRGGGDAVAEHVATGATIELAIRPTGSIEGALAMRAGTLPGELAIKLEGDDGYRRIEPVFHASRYRIRDLPQGTFEVSVISPAARGGGKVTLAAGQHATLDLALESSVTVTGRLVELGTRAPLPDIRMFLGDRVVAIEDGANTTDADGRFTLRDVPAGVVAIDGTPRDRSVRLAVHIRRTIPATATGVVELGELAVVRLRTGPNEREGRSGVRFTDPDDGPIDVAWIDPAGPAAKTDLRVGDRVVTVDGTDVTGDNAGVFQPLLAAPPGTVVKLGLARDATVAITLAAPP